MSTVNKAAFFAVIRKSLYGGDLPKSAVVGLETILDKCLEEGVHDLRQIAYVMATAFHEVGPDLEVRWENLNYSAEGLLKTWPTRFTKAKAAEYARQPRKIANYVYANRMGNGDEASGDGWRYRGGDFCQTTGKDNYRRAGKHAGVDLVKHPERIQEIPIAACNIVCGMRDGWFTGKKLGDYFPFELNAVEAEKANKSARRIINGTDKAALVAGYAEAFHKALTAKV